MPATSPSQPSLRDRCFALLATCGGLGYIPWAPGTFGTLMGVAWFAAAACLWPEQPGDSLLAWSPVTIALIAGLCFWSIVTIALGGWAERYFGKKDWAGFVSDEAAGFLLTVLLFRWPGHPWLTMLLAFPVWRFFDIAKLPPVRQIEHLPRGWGVLMDDLASAVYAALFLHLAVLALGYISVLS